MPKYRCIPITSFCQPKSSHGFTLMEMSIVLVIIGLIIGGVVYGQDLIRIAAMRAQVAQINKYNAAVNAFDTKYNGLPGDLQLTTASQNAFVTNGCDGKTIGSRNGDGLIQGGYQVGNPTVAYDQFHNETELFWQDLGTAGLIDAVFPAAGAATRDCTFTDTNQITLTNGLYAVPDFLPAGKMGYSQYLYVYSYNGDNYFGLSQVTGTSPAGNSWSIQSTPNIPVLIAAGIDKKMDDGMPQSGNVLANQYLTANTLNASPNWTGPASTNCYDTNSGNYDQSFNNGLGQNCALSFKIQ